MNSFLAHPDLTPIVQIDYNLIISNRIIFLNEKFRNLTITPQENMDREYLAFQYPHLLDEKSFVLPTRDILKEKLGLSDKDIDIFYDLASKTPNPEYNCEYFYTEDQIIFFKIIHMISDYINREDNI